MVENRKRKLVHAAKRLLEIFDESEIRGDLDKLISISSGIIDKWPYPVATESFQVSVYFHRTGIYLFKVIVQLEQGSDTCHTFIVFNESRSYVSEDFSTLILDMTRATSILRNLSELQSELATL